MQEHEIICPSCSATFKAIGETEPKFCVYCKALLDSTQATQTASSSSSVSHIVDNSTLIPQNQPKKEDVLFTLGTYSILESIGKGGMGEVFLAYDSSCGRKIALKQIRPDLVNNSHLHTRFLREAYITSQLAHPAIIPIYSIYKEPGSLYYTMPYIEGKTLRQLLSYARQKEKQQSKGDHLTSIPALMRIFLSICQAVAYAHARGVIHRDLKPNNIMVGKYGEVFILDWGLAKLISSKEEEIDSLVEEEEKVESFEKQADLTHAGKVVGTLAYMAPERALGHPASVQSDLYALGVMLYQILTLHYPFLRTTVKEFRQNYEKEVLTPPEELAPYRDISPLLSKIAIKALSKNERERYRSVKDFLHDIESYIEGRSEWISAKTINIKDKNDWEFQENVLFAEHVAVTRSTEFSDWVNLMISKDSFSGNTKIECKVRLGENAQGVGFLLCVPEKAERMHLSDGYCLWIGSDNTKNSRLLRDAVEVIYAPEICLQRDIWHQIRIEKSENNIHFYLNDALQFSYISHLPISGTHIGFLSRDMDFVLEDFTVFIGSENITVSCLAIPDAFLTHKNYTAALNEYRRISYSFSGLAEGREAMFRAGITLLEEAVDSKNDEVKTQKSEEALEEFSKLRNTPGAPLEYLGKALVYKSLEDYEEEVKCFDIAYRRYHHHPLLRILQEQLVYRMHESSRTNRKATYHFMLLSALNIPYSTLSSNTKQLFSYVKKHWEPLYFINESKHDESEHTEQVQYLNFSLHLAFWLDKTYVLDEIIKKLLQIDPQPDYSISNALFAMIELDAWEMAKEHIVVLKNLQIKQWIEIALIAKEFGIEKGTKAFLKALPEELSYQAIRVLLFLMQTAIDEKNLDAFDELYQATKYKTDDEYTLQIDIFRLWAFLIKKEWAHASELLHHYSLEQLTHETTELHFLYGCWLYVTEGKEIASVHFNAVLDVPYPRSWASFSHFYGKTQNQKELWLQRSFPYEKRKYLQQCDLFNSLTE